MALKASATDNFLIWQNLNGITLNKESTDIDSLHQAAWLQLITQIGFLYHFYVFFISIYIL